MSILDEVAIHDVVKRAVDHVYREVFIDSGPIGADISADRTAHVTLTSAQSRLAWMKVIEKLVQSAVIDAQLEVAREALKEPSPIRAFSEED